VNSLVCHVISHVLATVSDDDPGIVDRFMLRVYSFAEYLLKYATCILPLAVEYAPTTGKCL